MAFDIAKTSTVEAGDRGAFMAFSDPVTGLPFKDEQGKDVGVTLRSRLSHAAQAHQRNINNKRLEMARRGQEVSAEMIEAENTDLLTALTIGWTFDTLDEVPFEFSVANAATFWSDGRFKLHRDLALMFTGNEANFSKR